jgi:hypothetical protein
MNLGEKNKQRFQGPDVLPVRNQGEFRWRQFTVSDQDGLPSRHELLCHPEHDGSRAVKGQRSCMTEMPAVHALKMGVKIFA